MEQMPEKTPLGEWEVYVNKGNENDRLTARPVQHVAAGNAYEAVDLDGNHQGYFSAGLFQTIYTLAPKAVESGPEDQAQNESEDA